MNDQSQLDVLRDLIAGGGSPAYAVLDGASVRDLLWMLDQHQPESVCLFRGELTQDLQETSPYLVRLERNAPFTDWLLRNGWGNHWGIFARSGADLHTMRKHFRTFLTVKHHDGTPLYFRYYDPRVLRAFLPTCNAGELGILFGPVSEYVVEAKDPGLLIRYRNESGSLQKAELRLEGPPQNAFAGLAASGV